MRLLERWWRARRAREAHEDARFTRDMLAAVQALEMVATPLDRAVEPHTLWVALAELLGRRLARIPDQAVREASIELVITGLRRRVAEKLEQRGAAPAVNLQREMAEAQRATKH